MERWRRRCRVVACAILAVTAAACDDDGQAPMEPEPLDVSGVWRETAEITLDDCDLLPDTDVSTRILEQAGTSLVANVNGTILEGEIDPLTGEFTLELRVGEAFATQSGTFSSDTRYTAETTARTANGCRFESVEEGVRQSVLTDRAPARPEVSRFEGV